MKIKTIGIRPGEKLHEVLISEDESRHTVELEDMYVVEPPGMLWFGKDWREKGKTLPEGFRYVSNDNKDWMDRQELVEMLKEFDLG